MKFTIYEWQRHLPSRFTRRSSRRQTRRLSWDAAFGQHSTHKSQSLDGRATAFQSGVAATALQDRAVTRAIHGKTGRKIDFRKPFHNCRAFFLFPFSFFLAVAALVAPAQSTNDSSTTDFSSFRVIVDRNIFNPDRYGGGTGYIPRSYSVPTISLAGTMSYRKGMFAFFNGTSDEYRKALQQGATIAGYTVGKITFDGVELQSSGKTIKMQVGAAMRREGSNWELRPPGEWGDLSASGSTSASGSETTDQASTNTSVSLPSSGGAESDAIKRLMERRQQELK